MTDRCLVLRHHMVHGQKLDEKDTMEILKHIHKQTMFPVVIDSVDEDGRVVESFSSPPDYDYRGKDRRLNAQREAALRGP